MSISNKNLNDSMRIYFLCGNARTFEKCFDSAYSNIINKLFSNNTQKNTHLLLYLKCDDPGPKGQKGWNYEYKFIKKSNLEKILSKFVKKYKNITFHTEILETNKISDIELLKQLKNRKMYTGFLSEDKKLLRALHCHYNIEDCGYIINKIENEFKFEFDFFIYIRPDLFFKSRCDNINLHNINKIILGHGPLGQVGDHLALIPKKYKYEFFFERMNLFRKNNNLKFKIIEEIYYYTLKNKYYKKNLGKYFIKRK